MLSTVANGEDKNLETRVEDLEDSVKDLHQDHSSLKREVSDVNKSVNDMRSEMISQYHQLQTQVTRSFNNLSMDLVREQKVNPWMWVAGFMFVIALFIGGTMIMGQVHNLSDNIDELKQEINE